MKKNLLFPMLAAGALLASCSSDDGVTNNGSQNENGEGYVAFSIQLPQVAGGTRANDEFDDGTADEYAVKNGTLYLFVGSDETSSKYAGAYSLTLGTPVTGAGSQCTSEVTAVAHLLDANTDSKLYGYVILNHNDLIDVAANKMNGTTLTVGTSTFADFSKIELNKLGDASNGFVMTNAPVAATVGGTAVPTGNVTTLTELDRTKIFKTAAEAEATPAGDVYVERAAAKVTVSGTSLSGTLTLAPTVTYAKAITWALANQNTLYYNTRQMSNSWFPLVADGTDGTPAAATKYRFVSGSAVHAGIYRTYWGTDVNYSTTPTFAANPTVATINTALGKDVYTFENTFDVDRQSIDNTTCVMFSATFNDGKSFYTATTNGRNYILQIPGAGGKEVKDYVMEYLCANKSQFNTWYTTKAENRITVTMNDAVKGKATVKTVATGTGADALPSGITETELVTYINAAMEFWYYADGKAFYNIPIKHFGDSETPWTASNHTLNTIAGTYKTVKGADVSSKSDALYLGRYGVLRNNWYQVEVSGIRQIGTPVPGDPSDPSDPWTPGDPDDNVENFISVKIHITPWALRKQSVVL